MQRTLILALILVIAMATPKTEGGNGQDFEAWKVSHSLTYDASENQYRLFLFKQELAAIQGHNANPANTWSKGVNQFSAMTDEEFALTALGAFATSRQATEVDSDESQDSSTSYTSNPDSNQVSSGGSGSDDSDDPLVQNPVRKHGVSDRRRDPPVVITPIDWRTTSKVSAVKDQAACGSAYAFSVVGLIESAFLIDTANAQLDLSEQQIVDCTGALGNLGCNGGYVLRTLRYAVANGLNVEASYAYTGTKGASCTLNTGANKIVSYTSTREKVSGIYTALKTRPVLVFADGTNWRSYTSGVFSCAGSSHLNYAAVLVGVDSLKQWIVKGSFGTSWGTAGYITLHPTNNCGITRIRGYTARAV